MMIVRILATVVSVLVGSAATAAEMNFPVGGFDRISLGGSPDVTVTTGKTVSVHASGDQRALDRLDIRVEGNTLKIGNKRSLGMSWGNYGPVRIAVTVPMVRGLDIGGSGNIGVDRIKVPAFSASIGGSGNVRIAALDSQTASFDVAGSGDITAAGRCDSASLSVAGSGNIGLAGLKCGSLKANIAGSGNIDAHASQTASLSVVGSGDINVSGGAKCSVSKHGSGSVNCA
jgi:hypothetical protein